MLEEGGAKTSLRLDSEGCSLLHQDGPGLYPSFTTSFTAEPFPKTTGMLSSYSSLDHHLFQEDFLELSIHILPPAAIIEYLFGARLC